MRATIAVLLLLLGLAVAAKTDECAGQANVYIQLPADYPGTVDLGGFTTPSCPAGCSVSGVCDASGCVCDCSAPLSSPSASQPPVGASVSSTQPPIGSSPSMSAGPSPSASGGASPSLSPGASASGTPANTVTPSITASPASTVSPTSAASSTGSAVPSASAPSTVSGTAAVTSSPSTTGAPSSSVGASVTGTPSSSASPSNSPTGTPSKSATSSVTASNSPTGTPSNSATRTLTSSPTGTPSNSPTPSRTASSSLVPSQSPSSSAAGGPSASSSRQPLINPAGPFTRVITIPKATAFPTTVQTNCPSTTGGSSISGVTLSASPVANSFTVAAGTIVYVPAGRWPAVGTYGRITVAGTLVIEDANIQLYAMGIWVKSGGALLAGSATCRLEGPITIEFSDGVNIDGGGFAGRKGLYAEAGSTVQLFGHEYHYTWTRLAASLAAGSSTMQLQESVNWQPGQRILIAPTILMDEYEMQYEVRTIASVSGFTLTTTTPVTFHHYGGIEYQAEVALLDRNIVVQGDSASVAAQFGAHMLMRTVNAQIAGVRCFRCGQTNQLARYPVHFHMAGDAPNGLFSDNVVENSFYRAFVIHSTNNVTVTRNVAYNVTGHAFYMSEDGTESSCTISFNFGAYVHWLGTAAGGPVQSGARFLEDSVALQPADHAASPFYITNPDNDFIGNAACGGWAGYSIVGMWETLSQIPNYNPSEINIRQFRGNTVHSTGYMWSSGCGVYVGGRLWRDPGTTKLVYDSGRWGGPSNDFNIRDTRSGTAQAIMIFQDLRVSLAKLGFNDWGERQEIYRYEVADVGRSAVVFGDAYINNMWVTARSGNPQLTTMKIPCNWNGGNCVNIGEYVGIFQSDYGSQGFQYYDISVKVIISTVTFENFQKMGPAVTEKQNDNVVVLAMTHSDQFKPYGISAIRNVTYINTDSDLVIGYSDQNGDNGCNCKTGASRQFNVVDWDGTLYPAAGFPSTLFGSNENYWNLPKHTCAKHPYWGTWYCNREDTLVAGINVVMPGAGLSDSCSSNPGGVQNPQLGSVVHFGATDSSASLWITACPGILLFTMGADNLGMYLRFNSGPQAVMEIKLDMIPGGSAVFIGTPYPAGTTFTSVVCWKDWSSTPVTMAVKASRAACRDDTSTMPVYFWDSTNNILYMKLRDPERIGLTDYYDRGNAKLWYQFGAELFGWKSSKVVVTAVLGGGSVDNSDAKIPPAL